MPQISRWRLNLSAWLGRRDREDSMMKSDEYAASPDGMRSGGYLLNSGTSATGLTSLSST
jgi:hypothetical protein